MLKKPKFSRTQDFYSKWQFFSKKTYGKFLTACWESIESDI